MCHIADNIKVGSPPYPPDDDWEDPCCEEEEEESESELESGEGALGLKRGVISQIWGIDNCIRYWQTAVSSIFVTSSLEFSQLNTTVV